MRRPLRTRTVSSAQVRAYVGKAEEYAEAAASELESGRNIAATSLAIHAAINAADAVCGARVGKRAAGEDHDHVLALLDSAGRDGVALASDLRRLLPLKTKTEYEPDDVAPRRPSSAPAAASRSLAGWPRRSAECHPLSQLAPATPPTSATSPLTTRETGIYQGFCRGRGGT